MHMIDQIRRVLAEYSFTVGLAIRLVVAWLFPLLLDDGRIIPGVAYTDVDYHVFVDAANYIRNGESPYQRHTYRYTPFLALILSKLDGRYLFCVADAICGKLILHLQNRPNRGRPVAAQQKPTLASCFMWMYNPLVINICTRGSAESFIVLLPVLLTVTVIQSNMPLKALLAGILHGIAVHSKVYPVIYTLSFIVHLATPFKHSQQRQTLLASLLQWIRRLLRPEPLMFVVAFLVSFCGLTYLAVILYGNEALQEGLLYHLSRVDHRHNYSMWWYPIYLARRQLSGTILILPQLILLFVTSLVRADDLGWTLFIQTYIFVTFNKVITAQYFTWYLCLLPLCHFDNTKRLRNAACIILGGIINWLLWAYLLEMQGLPVHRLVWVASVMYFLANVNMLRVWIQSSAVLLSTDKPTTPTQDPSKEIKKED